MCSHIYMQTHACSAFDNCVTLTFEPQVNACRGPAMQFLPSLALLAQAFILVERGQTVRETRHTDVTDQSTMTASVVDNTSCRKQQTRHCSHWEH